MKGFVFFMLLLGLGVLSEVGCMFELFKKVYGVFFVIGICLGY